jgi:hypothetical protein
MYDIAGVNIQMMGFGLLTKFVGFFDTQRMTTLYSTLLHTHTLVSKVMYSLPLLGSGFQRQMFPLLWLPKLSLASAGSFY